ncbi:hypothetical protein EK21DRAFT_112942 [Setomelanomma holmii]|uniref:Xylanolytic transcriptional activator regulatory domain-containing protein n=1 Tax=Setomelanomma holmii TaxID=210430 RepID=A0A9P4LJN2_9PLEO|nr:hypothetical protein EK21DRAFT_112942 [Setomelanomma holmii]
MVYAIGSLALGPAHRDSADAYYSMALDRQAAVLDTDGLESIQSILCCTVYFVRSPIGASLWKISDMAIRHYIELGYHRSVAKYRKLTDPLCCVHSGPTIGIPDDVIDVELPCDLEDDHITKDGITKQPRLDSNDPPTYMTGAIHVIKLRQLWSRFADNLYPTTTKPSGPHSTSRQVLAGHLRQELEEWYATIPEPIDYSGPHPLSVFASKTWFQLAYNHSILLLNRHYITITPPPGEEESVATALEQRAIRAREICLLYRRLYQTSTIQFTWGSLHIFFMAGMTYLYCLWRSARVRQAVRQADVINTCMACNTVLVIMAERWTQATVYRDTFETLSEKTVSMICTDRTQPLSAMSNLEELAANAANDLDQLAVSQDWIVGLDDLSIPNESEWFIQELLQGMRDFQQPDITYDDLADFTR